MPSYKEENESKNKRQLKQDLKERQTDFEGEYRNQQLNNDEDYVDIIKSDKELMPFPALNNPFSAPKKDLAKQIESKKMSDIQKVFFGGLDETEVDQEMGQYEKELQTSVE